MEGPAAAFQTWEQLIFKLLAAEEEYERTGSEETLKAVVNTVARPAICPVQPRNSVKVNCLNSAPSRFPGDLCRMVCVLLRQRLTYRAVKIAVLSARSPDTESRGNAGLLIATTSGIHCAAVPTCCWFIPAAYPEDWDLLLTNVFHKTWPLAPDPDATVL